MTDIEAVVVGAGIAGLAAAHRLHTLGHDVAVLERSGRVGGQIGTVHDAGFVVEQGPDSFVSAKGTVLQLAAELGIRDRVVSSRPEHRGADIWWEGRLHPLPEGLLLMAPSRLRPVLTSSILSWRGKLRLLADLVLPRSRRGGDESLESFVVRRLGREMLDRIAEPLVAGIHAAEPATMSLAASFPRFLDMEKRHRSLILAARTGASFPPTEGGPSYFASFRDGMEELPATLANELGAAAFHFDTAVTGLVAAPGGNGYHLRLADGSVVSARTVVVATPAPVAAGLLAAAAPRAAATLRTIGQVPSATVTLAYRPADLPQSLNYGFVVPAVQNRRILGVTYTSQKWEGRVPDPSLSLLRAFVRAPGSPLPSADRLSSIVTEELRSMIGVTAQPQRLWVHGVDAGIHRYTLGHLDRVAAVEQALRHLPGLAVAGAALYGVGLNECIASGKAAADSAARTLGSSPDVPARGRR